ncbi:MAG TPA: twin-arginine translocation signal domain-containing protein, partial [Prolixibacteraceae bacterium]|nr:twin-arginine translocation signal domain-containing protein [Prolixibacteraceae bacterium]
MESRRKFIEKVAASSAALTIGSVASGMSAKSYGNIIGANDRIRVAMIGVNSRGKSMSATFAAQKNTDV